MRYRKKFIICSLLAGLIISISSCRSGENAPVFLGYKHLSDFPSASAAEFHEGRYYLFGDDARYFLQLDTALNVLDSIHYSTDTAYRLQRKTKPDLESVALFGEGRDKSLIVLGSFSSKWRKHIYQFPLSDLHTYRKLDPAPLQEALSPLKEVNIEGLAVAGDDLILANRANKKQTLNQLVIIRNYWSAGGNSSRLINIVLPSEGLLGISGLYYYAEKDIMLFTASDEQTGSATEDGAIGNSFIGWVRDFSKKTGLSEIKPQGFFDLSLIHTSLGKQKIESVCVERNTSEGLHLLLAADNDAGDSGLFRIRVSL